MAASFHQELPAGQMVKRPYLLVALAVLVAAPLIANLVSSAVPSAPQTAAADTANVTQGAAAEAQPTPAPPPLPSPVSPPMIPSANDNASTAIEPAPSLDPQGFEPEPGSATESIATQVARSEREDADEERDDRR
ncbi:MAG TPA: hypothetical protein VFF84_02675 [Sphingobium sp.]|nr:hypothetical protein [Sphingobium sp.]